MAYRGVRRPDGRGDVFREHVVLSFDPNEPFLQPFDRRSVANLMLAATALLCFGVALLCFAVALGVLFS